jgi:hypothetical protein
MPGPIASWLDDPAPLQPTNGVPRHTEYARKLSDSHDEETSVVPAGSIRQHNEVATSHAWALGQNARAVRGVFCPRWRATLYRGLRGV